MSTLNALQGVFYGWLQAALDLGLESFKLLTQLGSGFTRFLGGGGGRSHGPFGGVQLAQGALKTGSPRFQCNK